jgi:hypothetical protein
LAEHESPLPGRSPAIGSPGLRMSSSPGGVGPLLVRLVSLLPWSRWGQRGPHTPCGAPGPTIPAARACKTQNSGWPITQNKANLPRAQRMLTSAHEKAYGRSVQLCCCEKQSQFVAASVRPFGLGQVCPRLSQASADARPTNRRVAASLQVGTNRAEQSQFAEGPAGCEELVDKGVTRSPPALPAVKNKANLSWAGA